MSIDNLSVQEAILAFLQADQNKDLKLDASEQQNLKDLQLKNSKGQADNTRKSVSLDQYLEGKGFRMAAHGARSYFTSPNALSMLRSLQQGASSEAQTAEKLADKFEQYADLPFNYVDKSELVKALQAKGVKNPQRFENVHAQWVPILLTGLKRDLWDGEVLNPYNFQSPPNDLVQHMFDHPIQFDLRKNPKAGNQLLSWALSKGAKQKAADLVINHQLGFETAEMLLATKDTEVIDIASIAVKHGVGLGFPEPNLMTPSQMKTNMVLKLAIDRFGLDSASLQEASPDAALNLALQAVIKQQGFGDQTVDLKRLYHLSQATTEVKRHFLLAMTMGKINKVTLDSQKDDLAWMKGSAIEALQHMAVKYGSYSPPWVRQIPETVKLPESGAPVDEMVFEVEDGTVGAIVSSHLNRLRYLNHDVHGQKIEELLLVAESGKKIKTLHLSSHGRDGEIGFAAAAGGAGVPLNKDNFEEYQKVFRQLAPFIRGGTLVLHGCQIGASQESYILLSRLAEALECRVLAGTTPQSPVSAELEGYQITVAYPDGMVRREANPQMNLFFTTAFENKGVQTLQSFLASELKGLPKKM